MCASWSRFSFIFGLLRYLIPLFWMIAVIRPAYAGDYFVQSVGDYGNVTVMEFSGNYDLKTSGETLNELPRQLIAQEFFKSHQDIYDFIVIFTNFDFQLAPGMAAFYVGVKNDVLGIGRELFDNSSLYGSNGKLQGTIDMGNVARLIVDPLNPGFEQTLSALSHELLHRWGSYVSFKDHDGSVSKALLGMDSAHWSFLFDSGGSLEYGNKWQDNGDGTFTSGEPGKHYSPLDLYLMGMIDKSAVPPMLLIDNPTIDPTRLPQTGVTVNGTPRIVTIDDIIAAEGNRIPASTDAQKKFTMAFVLVTTPGTFSGNELSGIENVRRGFLPRYSILTDGRGLVQISPGPDEEIPVNPGVFPPDATPRTLPPNIDEGIAWLVTKQQDDGSWTDSILTTERDTAEAVVALKNSSEAQQQVQDGLQWLAHSESASTDYIARRLEAVIGGGGTGADMVGELLARRNPDGGWGSGRNFTSTPVDTALALSALGKATAIDQPTVTAALVYLQGCQNADGGWAGGDFASTIQSTAAVLKMLNVYRASYALDGPIARGGAFLQGKQNPDGGFGNSPSTVYDTATSVMVLRELRAPSAVTDAGIAYLHANQSINGSWNESIYQTSLALNVLWRITTDPDLTIAPADLVISPSTLTAIPADVSVGAIIRNLGKTGVSNVSVALYDDEPVPGNKRAELKIESLSSFS